jgi:3-hydroxyisobutyrate dehydrogenase-like beta-hydroxyacid dehydrogenase
MSSKPPVGVVGAGDMGLPMIRNLLSAGFDVHVFDPDAEATRSATAAGARSHDSVSALGTAAEVVFVVVPTDDHVRAATTAQGGLFETMTDGVVAINSSTRPDLPADVQEAAPDGVDVVDAPMCRGAMAAEAGNILFLVGGREAAIARARSAFEVCGELEVLGALGAGQVGKTSNNLLMWISILADYEVLRLAEQLPVDIDPMRLREVLPKSSGDNWAIRRGNWEGLRLSWPEKDLAIALDLADEADASVPMSGLASQLMKNLDVPDLEPYYFQEES